MKTAPVVAALASCSWHLWTHRSFKRWQCTCLARFPHFFLTMVVHTEHWSADLHCIDDLVAQSASCGYGSKYYSLESSTLPWPQSLGYWSVSWLCSQKEPWWVENRDISWISYASYCFNFCSQHMVNVWEATVFMKLVLTKPRLGLISPLWIYVFF